MITIAPAPSVCTEGDSVLRSSCLQCEHYGDCSVPSCIGPLDDRTVGIYADMIDGSRVILASVSADTYSRAVAAAQAINPQTLFA